MMPSAAIRAAARVARPVERFETQEDCAGYSVRDPRGRKLGRLRRLYLNDRGGPEYAEVGVGLFGLRAVLIPILAVAVDETRRVLVLE
jgi:hypothetical protein